MFTFRMVQPETDRDRIIAFFVDSANGEDDPGFDEEEYMEFVRSKVSEWPEGFVFAEKNGTAVGELVLRIVPFEGRDIGYISLVYITPNYRGTGLSAELFTYAEQVFTERNINEYHLRVSQTNPRAIRFYEKQGLQKLGAEYNARNQLCWRMGKFIES